MLTNTIAISTIIIIIMMMSSSSWGNNNNNTNNTLKAIESLNRTCECTEHRDLCLRSLSPYAALLLREPCRLPYVAVRATFEDAKNASLYVRGVMPLYAANHSVAAALRDCAENLDGVVGEIGDSLNQTKWLYTNDAGSSSGNCSAVAGEDFRFHVANLKTWMSAALTGEVTCADELESMGDPLRSNVSCETSRVQMVVSNALALINNIFN